METDIVIFSPDEKPFGPLSNNFRSNLLIDGKLYNTVTNYVYSLPLKSGTFKKIVMDGPTKNLHDIRDQLIRDEQIGIIKNALKRALKVKFLNTPIGKELAATGQSQLIYRSNNTILGVNNQGVGENLLGNMLMAIRREQLIITSRITKQAVEQKFYDKLYDTYLLYLIFKQKVMNGSSDFIRYIQAYDMKAIIAKEYGKIIKKEDGTEIIVIQPDNAPSKDTIIELYNKNLLPSEVLEELRVPGYLSFNILKKFGLTYIAEFNRQIEQRIFDLFTQKVAEKHVPETYNNTYGKYLISKDISILTPIEKEKIMETLMKAYWEQLLDDDIYETIYKEFEENLWLSEEDIEGMRQSMYEVTIREKKITDNLNTQEVEKLGEVLGEMDSLKEFVEDMKAFTIMFPNIQTDNERRDAKEIWKHMSPDEKLPYFQILKGTIEDISQTLPLYTSISPEINFTDDYDNEPFGFLSNDKPFMMTIDYLKYPSVTHYVAGCLFTTLSYVGNINQAHPYLLFDPQNPNRNDISSYKPPSNIMKEYYERIEDDVNTLTINGIKLALEIKFSNGEMASLLLATGNVPIIYEDFSDGLLGVGPDKKGLNLTGNELVMIRHRLAEEGVYTPAVIDIQPAPSIADVVKNDPSIRKWFTDRTEDIVQSIKYFAGYLRTVGFPIADIDTRIAAFVIYNLYSACIPITEKYTDVKQVPTEFKEMVKDLFGDMRATGGVIKLIWKYISLLTFYLVEEYAKAENLDISKVLTDINTKFISPTTRCDGPYKHTEKPAENCIISGVVNILGKVKKYIQDSGRFFIVSDPELILAFNLITPDGYNGELTEYPTAGTLLIKFFEKNGLNITTDVASKVLQFTDDLIQNKEEISNERILSRIFFFATLN